MHEGPGEWNEPLRLDFPAEKSESLSLRDLTTRSEFMSRVFS